jgi:hypothetical protein
MQDAVTTGKWGRDSFGPCGCGGARRDSRKNGEKQCLKKKIKDLVCAGVNVYRKGPERTFPIKRSQFAEHPRLASIVVLVELTTCLPAAFALDWEHHHVFPADMYTPKQLAEQEWTLQQSVQHAVHSQKSWLRGRLARSW